MARVGQGHGRGFHLKRFDVHNSCEKQRHFPAGLFVSAGRDSHGVAQARGGHELSGFHIPDTEFDILAEDLHRLAVDGVKGGEFFGRGENRLRRFAHFLGGCHGRGVGRDLQLGANQHDMAHVDGKSTHAEDHYQKNREEHHCDTTARLTLADGGRLAGRVFAHYDSPGESSFLSALSSLK